MSRFIKKPFNLFIDTILNSNRDLSYFTNYEKVLKRQEQIRNFVKKFGTIKSKSEFIKKLKKILFEDPNLIKFVPSLSGIRSDTKNFETMEVELQSKKLVFKKDAMTVNEVIDFLNGIGFMKIFCNGPTNIESYTLGIEVGMDSNTRKNRSGELARKTVTKFLDKKIKDSSFQVINEVSLKQINEYWNVNLATTKEYNKRFDAAFKTKDKIFLVEINYFNNGGSKSSVQTALADWQGKVFDKNGIYKIEFLLITDGPGLKKSKKEFKEVYDKIKYVMNVDDLNNGALDLL